MGSLNKVQLIGRLGKDPDVRYTSAGQAVANFTLATDETYKDREGEKKKTTTWHNIVVWGKVAEEFVGKYLKKGMLVYAEGKLQTRSWDDKTGNKKYTTEVNVHNIINLEPKRDSGNAQTTQPANELQDEACPF
jgi:single-strand DNA-binding protein